MCRGRRSQPQPLPPPQPIQPRNPDLVRVSQKPKERELLDEDEVRAGVEYGKRDSQDTRAGARSTGTDALKIDINTGYTGGQSGGVNTGV